MSVGDVADPTEGVAAFLLAQVGSTVEGRVYRPELPQLDDPLMPTSAIVVMPAGAGGLLAGSRLEVVDSMVDVLCYGETRLNADNLARQAQSALKYLKMQVVECPEAGGKMLLYWAREASGTNPRQEGQANWAYSEFTIQLLHSEFVL